MRDEVNVSNLNMFSLPSPLSSVRTWKRAQPALHTVDRWGIHSFSFHIWYRWPCGHTPGVHSQSQHPYRSCTGCHRCLSASSHRLQFYCCPHFPMTSGFLQSLCTVCWRAPPAPTFHSNLNNSRNFEQGSLWAAGHSVLRCPPWWICLRERLLHAFETAE